MRSWYSADGGDSSSRAPTLNVKAPGPIRSHMPRDFHVASKEELIFVENNELSSGKVLGTFFSFEKTELREKKNTNKTNQTPNVELVRKRRSPLNRWKPMTGRGR